MHLLEAGPVEMDRVFIVAKQVGPIAEELDLELSDDDPCLENPMHCGENLKWIIATVGKDLGACFWTDDTELVESGELRQQTTLCPGVAINFMTGPKISLQTKLMNKN